MFHLSSTSSKLVFLRWHVIPQNTPGRKQFFSLFCRSSTGFLMNNCNNDQLSSWIFWNNKSVVMDDWLKAADQENNEYQSL